MKGCDPKFLRNLKFAKKHNSETDVLVRMVRNYGNEKKFEKWKHTLETISGYLKEIPNTMIAVYTIDNNYYDKDFFDKNMDSMGQWIWLFPSSRAQGSKPLLYSGKRSQKNILKWLKKKAPRITVAWSTVKEATKKAKEAIEERKRVEEEKKKAYEEQLEKLEKIDISGDGGIIKQILSEGDGVASPTTGANVKAHYTGKLLDGTTFDSSVERGTPFTFSLGQGQVIKCWDQGFATMKKSEKALLTCKPDYAYGENGSGPTIPGGATLRFEVELLSWEGGESGDIKDEL